MPIPVAITSYKMYQIQDPLATVTAPKNFKIYASNNGVDWTILQTITNATYTSYIYNNTGLSTNTITYLR